jgi:hypothetical protein
MSKHPIGFMVIASLPSHDCADRLVLLGFGLIVLELEF